MDVRTLVFALVEVLTLLAVLGLVIAFKRREPALIVWALGLAGSATGFILVVFSAVLVWPGWLFLGNLLILSYNFALPIGLRLFLGRRPAWPLWSMLFFGLAALFLFWFSVVTPSYPPRVMGSSLVVGLLALEFLVVLLCRGTSISLTLRILLSLLAIGYAIFQALRIVVLQNSVAVNLLEDKWLAPVTFFVTMGGMILWSGALLITDSEALVRRLREEGTEMQRLNLLKDRVLAMTGHDLRGPLANLGLIWDQIGTPIREGRAVGLDPEMVVLVDKSLVGTQDLLENLFSFADAQRSGVNGMGPTDLTEAANKAVDLWLIAARTKGVTLLLGGPALRVAVDPNSLSAVLRNLVANAVKFTPSGGSVSVSWRPSAEGAVLEVIDTGVGMDVDTLAHTASRGPRPSRPGTSGERGSGFGLVLVHELVDGWGGSIRFDSAPGKGTCVAVTLPSVPGKPSEAAPSAVHRR